MNCRLMLAPPLGTSIASRLRSCFTFLSSGLATFANSQDTFTHLDSRVIAVIYISIFIAHWVVYLLLLSYSYYKEVGNFFKQTPFLHLWSSTPFFRGAVYSGFWFVFILCFPLVRKNEQSEILQRCLVCSMIKNQPMSQNHEKIEVPIPWQ